MYGVRLASKYLKSGYLLNISRNIKLDLNLNTKCDRKIHCPFVMENHSSNVILAPALGRAKVSFSHLSVYP